MNTDLTTAALSYQIQGLFYGYPKCCIDEFVQRHEDLEEGRITLDDHLSLIKSRPLYGTGYVPCLLCSATYTDEEMAERINTRRFAPRPFHENATQEELESWLTNMRAPYEQERRETKTT